MAKKNKTLTVEDMKKSIIEGFAEIAPDLKINFDPDVSLDMYQKGSQLLTPEDMKNLQVGDVVWIHHTDCGRLRFKGPMRLENRDCNIPNDECFMFGDGSIFGLDLSESEWDDSLGGFEACDHTIMVYSTKVKSQKSRGKSHSANT